MAWNLHIVGQELEDELEEVLQRFIADLEGVGHKLTGATLTTDAGQKQLPTAPVEEPAQTVGGEPVAPPTSAETTIAVSGPEVEVDTPPSLPDTSVA